MIGVVQIGQDVHKGADGEHGEDAHSQLQPVRFGDDQQNAKERYKTKRLHKYPSETNSVFACMHTYAPEDRWAEQAQKEPCGKIYF